MNEFKTTDLGLAATLMTQGFKVQRLDKTDRRRINFVFEDTNTLKLTIQEFWGKEISVEPNALLNAMKQLKNRLFNSDVP